MCSFATFALHKYYALPFADSCFCIYIYDIFLSSEVGISLSVGFIYHVCLVTWN